MSAQRRTARVLVGALSVVALAGLVGCSSRADQGLSQSELVVVFAPDVTAAQVQAARSACNGVGGAKAEKPGPDNAANRANPLRFDITGLGLTAQTQLSECLSKQAGVRGYTTDDSDS